MTQFVFIILCALIASIYSTAELNCGRGEVEDNCPDDCDLDYCPKHEDYKRSCDKPAKCRAPACKCSFNYSRANNGTCISTWDCPAFPCSRPNEEYVPCPSHCPTDDCSQATPDGRCLLIGYILTVVECKPACRCKKGFWRKNRVCVPYADCPGTTENNSKKFWDIYRIFNN